MKGYELSPEARDDLQEIWVYIASDNPSAADKLEEDIYAACELLSKNPHVGHKRPDLTDEPVRIPSRRASAASKKDTRSGIARSWLVMFFAAYHL
jgi:plasmid stabilization system protein ParE